MYVEVGWPVRSTQQTNIVLTLQASLENQSLTQGYTVCCRKRLTLGYDCYALTGLMNAMSRNYTYCPTKNVAEYFVGFEPLTTNGILEEGEHSHRETLHGMFALFEDDFLIRYYNRRFPSVTSGYAEFAPFGDVYSKILVSGKILI